MSFASSFEMLIKFRPTDKKRHERSKNDAVSPVQRTLHVTEMASRNSFMTTSRTTCPQRKGSACSKEGDRIVPYFLFCSTCAHCG